MNLKSLLLAIATCCSSFLPAQTPTFKCLRGDCGNGQGSALFPNGTKYDGQFSGGRLHGLGVMTYPTRDIFSGDWQFGVREGRGRLKYANGDEYFGTFRQNNMNGQGKMTYANGAVYEGNWVGGQIQGQGTLTFPNKDIYTGNFIAGRSQGLGTMRYANGERYEGEWKQGKRHGEGTLFLLGGKTQKGFWDKDVYLGATRVDVVRDQFNLPVDSLQYRNCNNEFCASGVGRFTYKNGTVFTGSFVNGQPNGNGKTRYNNGDRYEGGWMQSYPQGRGIMYYTDGRVLGAVWDKGQPKQKLFEENQKPPVVNPPKPLNPAAEVKIWAVVVGAAHYNHLVTLRYTDDDAYHVYAFLKSPEGGAIPENQIRLIIDEDATKSAIMAAVNTVFQKADDNDVIFFYFSGHGIQGAFLPVDYDGHNNRINHEELRQVIERSKAKHKIIVADACHAGSFSTLKTPIHLELEKYYQTFATGKGGTALFLSSKSEEYSLEDNGLRSGVFSHFLIKGARGPADNDQNRIVTVKELFDYVSQNVRSYTANVQTPLLMGNFDRTMPFALVR
jgi:hypothetical protein